MISFMLWKDRRNVLKSETNRFLKTALDWNVSLQRPEYVARSETIKSATESWSNRDRINFMPACFRTCWSCFENLWASWGTSLKGHRLFTIMPRKASGTGFAKYWCVLLLWSSFGSDQYNCFWMWLIQFFFLTIKSNVSYYVTGGRQNKLRCPV